MKSIKFVFLKAIVIVFFTFCTNSSFSQNPSETLMKTDGANKVQFMGIENNFLLFDLLFMEVPAKGCTLKIMDNDGNIMLEETISRKFLYQEIQSSKRRDFQGSVLKHW